MRFLRTSGTVLWLTALWCLLWRSVSVANVVSGLALSFAVLALVRLPQRASLQPDQRPRFGPIASIRFGVFIVYKLIEANLYLAWEIMTPRNRIRTGVIAVPLRTRSETAMMVVANAITLTPGTVTIEVLGSPPVLYVHVLHLHDIEKVRADLLHLEELAIRAFGSPAMRRELREASA